MLNAKVEKTKYQTAANRRIMKKGSKFFVNKLAPNGKEMEKVYNVVAKKVNNKKIVNRMAVPAKIRPAKV
jgi:hypothetical protein